MEAQATAAAAPMTYLSRIAYLLGSLDISP
jgi:hypothetical protein